MVTLVGPPPLSSTPLREVLFTAGPFTSAADLAHKLADSGGNRYSNKRSTEAMISQALVNPYSFRARLFPPHLAASIAATVRRIEGESVAANDYVAKLHQAVRNHNSAVKWFRDFSSIHITNETTKNNNDIPKNLIVKRSRNLVRNILTSTDCFVVGAKSGNPIDSSLPMVSCLYTFAYRMALRLIIKSKVLTDEDIIKLPDDHIERSVIKSELRDCAEKPLRFTFLANSEEMAFSFLSFLHAYLCIRLERPRVFSIKECAELADKHFLQLDSVDGWNVYVLGYPATLLCSIPVFAFDLDNEATTKVIVPIDGVSNCLAEDEALEWRRSVYLQINPVLLHTKTFRWKDFAEGSKKLRSRSTNTA